jgi:hypothetical protein
VEITQANVICSVSLHRRSTLRSFLRLAEQNPALPRCHLAFDDSPKNPLNQAVFSAGVLHAPPNLGDVAVYLKQYLESKHTDKNLSLPVGN